MKRKWAAAVLLLILTGCVKEDAVIPTLDAASIVLEKEYVDVGYGNGKLYLFDGTAADVYDASAGTWSSFENLPGTCIDVYGNELIVSGADGVILAEDGKMEQLPFDPVSWGLGSVSLCSANDTWIAMAGQDASSPYLEHRVILMERKSGECEDWTEKLKKNYEVLSVNGMDFDDNGGLYLTVKVTTEIDNDDNVCLILRDGEVTEIPVPRCEDGRWDGGALWYRDGTRLKKYDFIEMTSATSGVYSPEILAALTGTLWESREVRMFLEGYNVILASVEDRRVYIDRLVYDSMPLRILAPDHVHFWDRYEEILLEYRTEYRRNVEVVDIPQEAWSEKLLLKLMAQDSDFDLYWIADPSADTVLASILDKNRYCPMSDDLFDKEGIPFGAVGMFRDEGNLYGFPMDLSCWLIEVDRELFDTHGLTVPEEGWTADDLWNLCGEVRKLGTDLYVFGDAMEISAYLVQEWLETEPEDQQSLLKLAQNIETNADVLGAPINPGEEYRYDTPALLNITWRKSLPTDELYENTLPYPRYREDTPQRFRVNGLLMVNPDSENTADAMILAEKLWNPDELYGKAYHDLYGMGGIVLRGGFGAAIGEHLPELFVNGADFFADAFGRRVRMYLEG